MVLVLFQLHLEDGRGTPCLHLCSVLLSRSELSLFILFCPHCEELGLFILVALGWLQQSLWFHVCFRIKHMLVPDVFLIQTTLLKAKFETCAAYSLIVFCCVCSRQSGAARTGLWSWSERCVAAWTEWCWSCWERASQSTTRITQVTLLRPHHWC